MPFFVNAEALYHTACNGVYILFTPLQSVMETDLGGRSVMFFLWYPGPTDRSLPVYGGLSKANPTKVVTTRQ